MKKKKAMKLRLRKETVRTLDHGLDHAAGGTVAIGIGIGIGTVLKETIRILTPNTCCQSYCVTDPPTCLCTAPEVCCPGTEDG